ncbi:hypothetical protein M8997_004020 [Phyllobacterium sp. 21LDTY02-6]|uniref:hypothetical protein n=1 Tax=Phyllobacterium sp. 21LDTY02-6 TaxID=2944903 RepID=UPI002020AD67|nr:hypothetical protein [Phyllobacterium sp. 21LDTY02-6]MCO4316339.1 hypothetical protein [Phyllobacterium sp. 21LDTY02-6]
MTEDTVPRVDPDPFVIISIAIAAVAAAASVVQAGIAYKDRRTLPATSASDAMAEGFQRSIRNGMANVEKLIKFLAKSDFGKVLPLEERFAFGNTVLLMSFSDLHRYDSIASQLSFDIGLIHTSMMGLIRYAPETANKIGLEFLNEMSDYKDRINGFYRSDQRNGEVLDDALKILRTFERVLTKLEGN